MECAAVRADEGWRREGPAPPAPPSRSQVISRPVPPADSTITSSDGTVTSHLPYIHVTLVVCFFAVLAISAWRPAGRQCHARLTPQQHPATQCTPLCERTGASGTSLNRIGPACLVIFTDVFDASDDCGVVFVSREYIYMHMLIAVTILNRNTRNDATAY